MVENVIMLYQLQGFEVCADTSLEEGFEKVILYATGGRFQHAALQKNDGTWTSKLAEHEDVEHDSPEVLLGGEYKAVVCVLKRRRKESA